MLNFDQQELVAIFKRVAAQLKTRQGTLAEDVYRIPVSTYCDRNEFRQELDDIFRRRPLPLALSAEIRQPGSYYALTVLGTPVVLTRTRQGEVRAFLNACRHRGMQVVPDGAGRAPRLTCIYHGWSYALDGRLVGLAEEATFGAIDKCTHGLTTLSAEERFGIVWVVLTPNVPCMLDDWLGSLAPHIQKMGLEEFEVFAQWRLESANWKLAMEGYLENYHFSSLHGKGLATYQVGNFGVFDAFGPHTRQVSCLKTIEGFEPPVERQWCTSELLQYAFNVFPNTQIAFGHVLPSERPVYWALVSQVFPDLECPGRSVTIQRIITSREVRGTELEAEIRGFAAMTQKTVRDEDNPAVLAVQATLNSGANSHFVLGRNEIALQHFHRSIAAVRSTTPVVPGRTTSPS